MDWFLYDSGLRHERVKYPSICRLLLSNSNAKWSNTLQQFVANLPTNCLSVSDHLVGLALKGLNGWAMMLIKIFKVSELRYLA